MARTISIGAQGFAEIREKEYFIVDKTSFVRDWWRAGDVVTLICRPRRFGKTLNMSMVECFLSTRYAGRSDLFEGLEVWDDDALRAEQGAWSVVSLSFANIEPHTFDEVRDRYAVRSNRESGYGRYDVMLIPRDVSRDVVFVLEFKVIDRYAGESTLEDTVAAAHAQIEGRRYAAELEDLGVPPEHVRAYSLAFEGKRVLVG